MLVFPSAVEEVCTHSGTGARIIAFLDQQGQPAALGSSALGRGKDGPIICLLPTRTGRNDLLQWLKVSINQGKNLEKAMHSKYRVTFLSYA
jgi:hypothetical protein